MSWWAFNPVFVPAGLLELKAHHIFRVLQSFPDLAVELLHACYASYASYAPNSPSLLQETFGFFAFRLGNAASASDCHGPSQHLFSAWSLLRTDSEEDQQGHTDLGTRTDIGRENILDHLRSWHTLKQDLSWRTSWTACEGVSDSISNKPSKSPICSESLFLS